MRHRRSGRRRTVTDEAGVNDGRQCMSRRRRSAGPGTAPPAGSARPGQTRHPFLVMAALTVPVVVYAFMPSGPVRDIANPATGLLCMATAFVGLLRAGRPRPGGWALVLGGFLGWALGDLQFMVEHTLLD